MIKKLYLYFLPGIVPTLLLLISREVVGESMPSITILIFIDFVVTIPLMIFLIARENLRPFSLQPIREIFNIQNCVMFKTSSLVITFCLLWALGCFVLLKPVNEFFSQTVFQWIPEWYTPRLLPENQSQQILQVTWFLMIPFSILMPLMEEVYFRGFLLPRERFNDWRAPLINTVLFCVYHLWSPQYFVTRIIAIFPMNYFVCKYKNIWLSIIPHVLLNLIGDVVITYPLIFGE